MSGKSDSIEMHIMSVKEKREPVSCIINKEFVTNVDGFRFFRSIVANGPNEKNGKNQMNGKFGMSLAISQNPPICNGLSAVSRSDW